MYCQYDLCCQNHMHFMRNTGEKKKDKDVINYRRNTETVCTKQKVPDASLKLVNNPVP